MPIRIETLKTTDASKAADIFARYPDEQPDFDAQCRPLFGAIEGAIAATDGLGHMPLWSEYTNVKNYGRKPMGANPQRRMNDVRTKANFCRFYAWLAATLAPDAIIEVGAAFGASGMYWLAGLKLADTGTLYSFEPNADWHPIAKENFDLIAPRHVLTLGTFEDTADRIKAPASIVLIDAIHTRDFVTAQLDLARQHAKSGALILFDDINFSDEMAACWADIQASNEWAGVWQLGARVGVIELP
ncbi:O-methyltransferase [Pseudooctadecabacter jejudonensis]|uniref:O-methyltransferase n=1 Tax=Pseudooctadecabacter jejudonensis TaxID=1391910 RepID=A0A1Y5SD00_9RHOB|nr:class I SAM-dependent methyltransferase [Pseudooctadecabacter jejudonensis]SLN34796.1 hypothetical protein PSJ8397_01736 [Pseudooctadecabacter jejudonensis]